MKIYLFNPETDLALAADRQSYTASEKIRRMAHDLAVLPLWYAEAGSGIWVPDDEAAEFVESTSRQLGLNFFAVRKFLRPNCEVEISPWGWNRVLRHWLLREGVGEEALPAEQTLSAWRQISSRARVAEVLRHFQDDEACVGASANLMDAEACRLYAEAHPEGVVFKSPWSSSGKGLCWCRDGFTERMQSWCAKVIKEQGLVTAQPLLNRIIDFAMEFHAGKCWEFVGYSLFRTNAQGGYEGNLLLSDAEIERTLGTYVNVEVLHRVRDTLLRVLNSFDYQGYMGVDMMICKVENGYGIHPCVEMNWRMNMGVLSHIFTERFLEKDVKALFLVENYPTPSALQADFGKRLAEHPAQIRDRKLLKGILPLTPVGKETVSVAYVSTF